jgi:thiol-disulfide isomerase/thioredoxin
MRLRLLLCALYGAWLATCALAQTAPPTAAPKPVANPTPQSPSSGKQPENETADKAAEAEDALQRAVDESGNDRAALVRKLEEYLQSYPNAPRKAAVYRALLEASQQLHDYNRALDYAERLVVINPDDSQMMMVATGLLERQGDDHSLTKAVGYVSRVLDRVEKTLPSEKPPRLSVAEWESGQKRVRATLYLIRGRLEKKQRQYDVAQKDLDTSFHLAPTASAALELGEIAELRKDYQTAIGYYAAAFVLPESSPSEAVDRHEVRQNLGNCWRQVHGSDAGLGEFVLATYDRLNADAKPAGTESPRAKNKGAKEPYAFVLRALDGSAFPMAQLKGKIVVLNFWATWCGPCRELEPMFDQVAEKFTDKSDVVFFAVNTDEDETRVLPFLEREKSKSRVLFADGFDDFLEVASLPTVLILDRTGKIVYRGNGFEPGSFIDELTRAIEQVVRPAS